jgi:hypothetical protein
MGQLIASASMSLDGYIAKDDNTDGRRQHHFPHEPPSADYWKQWLTCAHTPARRDRLRGLRALPETAPWP